jgi:hypothetical protein
MSLPLDDFERAMEADPEVLGMFYTGRHTSRPSHHKSDCQEEPTRLCSCRHARSHYL